MIKTQMLHAGDLVAYKAVSGNIILGMIIAFDEAYTIQWFCPRPMTHATWKTTQEYRNIYLDLRKTL